jgi:cellulose synthase/poly-beta-1,6-N-acetylglucosamine synthase-like glycosyltransferase
MSHVEHRWHKWNVIAAWVGALATLAGVLIVLGQILFTEPDDRPDIQVIAEFHELYREEASRRFALQLLRSLSSACSREAMRQVVVWELLERNLATAALPSADTRFRFDSEHPDWHLLGDVLTAMRDDESCSRDFARWWQLDVRDHTMRRWPQHAAELTALYAWVESTYGIQRAADAPVSWTEPVLVLSRGAARGFSGPVVVVFSVTLITLIGFGLHRLWLWWRVRTGVAPPVPDHWPDTSLRVLVQLPIYNERHVALRVIHAAARLDWPSENLQIQVLDDSTDDTSGLVETAVIELRSRGIDVHHLRRQTRAGFKAGALAWGLTQAPAADLVCVFDADFEPAEDFLRKMTVHFPDPAVGLVQARWTYSNQEQSWLTRLQARMLDGHFLVDHQGRYRSGCFFNFNGTAGVWRRRTIDDAGGWHGDTLTEDLDLSYRAQLRSWKFVYRPDVEVPSELPVNILALKAQQRRWCRGSFQTVRKLLGAVWLSHNPIRCKLEATAHLLGNGGYLAVFLAGWLLLPVHLLGIRHDWSFVFDLELVLLVVGFASSGLFYWTAGRRVGRSRIDCLLSPVAIVVFGMGLSANNGMAVLRGAWGRRGEFDRTPKYGDERGWRQSPYRAVQPRSRLAIECLFLLYLCASALIIWGSVAASPGPAWRAMVFPVLFALSVACVTAMTCLHLLMQGRPGTTHFPSFPRDMPPGAERTVDDAPAVPGTTGQAT